MSTFDTFFERRSLIYLRYAAGVASYSGQYHSNIFITLQGLNSFVLVSQTFSNPTYFLCLVHWATPWFHQQSTGQCVITKKKTFLNEVNSNERQNLHVCIFSMILSLPLVTVCINVCMYAKIGIYFNFHFLFL